MIYIIGAGGAGSWLCPALCLLVGPDNVTVIDGDALEAGNLNRQLFKPDSLGKNKAAELARLYECQALPNWYNFGLIRHSADDWIFSCADNNAARRAILQSCDQYACQAIICANERNSAEAYLYGPGWQGAKMDPRVMYPELARDDGQDPQDRAIGCTGKAQEQTPQLVSANIMAVSLGLHLYVLWAMELPSLDVNISKLPHKLVANMTRLETHRVEDTERGKPVDEPQYVLNSETFTPGSVFQPTQPQTFDPPF